MAAIAAIGDDAGKAGADLRLDLRDDRRKRVAVVGIARQGLGVAANCPPLERWSVTAMETLRPNSHGRSSVKLVSTWHS